MAERDGRDGAAQGGQAPGGSGRRWRILGRRVMLVAVLALTGWLLHRTLSAYSLAEIGDALKALPVGRLAAAAGFATSSYACLTLFDALAIRYVGRAIPYPQVALTSFLSLSIGHSIGFAGLSSGAIRYRYYKRFGLSVGDVARVILFTGLTVGIGLAGLAGLALTLRPDLVAALAGLGEGPARLAGIACLGAIAAYLVAAALVERPLPIRRFRLEIPGLKLAALQTLVGTVNFALVAACLHQCLAGVAEVAYPQSVAVYVSANVATLVTHVPGGLGVIEAVTLTLVSGPLVIGSVLAFRTIYFLVPLAIGATLIAATEMALRRRGRAS